MLTTHDKYVIEGAKPPMDVPDVTLGELLHQYLLHNSDPLGVQVDAFTRKEVSYKKLLEEACNLAEALKVSGWNFQNKTIVSICSENSTEYFIPVAASLFNSTPIFPLNFNYSITELQYLVTIAKPSVIFCSHRVLKKIIELMKKTTFIKQIIVIDTDQSMEHAETLAEFIAKKLCRRISPSEFQPVHVDPKRSPAMIFSSSGTTGPPKAMLISSYNLVYSVTLLKFLVSLMGNDPVKVALAVLPFFHMYGFFLSMYVMLNNSKLVVFHKFEEDAYLRAVQDYKIERLHVVPPLVLFLMNSPNVKHYDLSSVKAITCGAAPLGKAIPDELKQKLHVQFSGISETYGMSECLIITINPTKPGSCGTVAPYNSCKIRDPETGKSLGPNQIGEICVKGPTVMMGYYNNEKATRESFTSDGWLKTGDLAYYDEEKHFFIVGRLKELIKYKGYQVSPTEIEAQLLNHPKIKDAAVIGLPDYSAGELPLAFVVKKQNVNLTEKEVQQYIAELLSPQKCLRGGVVFVDEIPKNDTGKINRLELKVRVKNLKITVESKL